MNYSKKHMKHFYYTVWYNGFSEMYWESRKYHNHILFMHTTKGVIEP